MTTEPTPMPGEPLSLPPDLGIENAAALKALLAPRYDDEAAVTVGASAVTRLHAAGLQVLAAFFHGRFDPKAVLARASGGGSFGVVGMAERAQLAGGTLQFESVPGGGTTLTAVLPLQRGAA